MSQTASSILISSLRGAHAMETHALEILEHQAARLERHPEFQSQIQHHLAETKRQIERLEECLDALGEDTCADKAPAAQAAVTGLSNAAPEEDILRNVFAGLALEHYEIAAYKSLLTLCEMAIQRSIAPLLLDSLQEEEAMARWLKENLPRLTRTCVG